MNGIRRRMKRLAVRPLIALLAAVCAAACGLTVSGTFTPSDGGGDATGAEDSGATSDAALGDAERADAVRDGDARTDASMYACGDAGVATCLGCEAGIYACRATGACVDDCKASCADSPIQCLACAGDASTPILARCELASDASACAAAPLNRCTCNDGPDCAGDRQVCVDGGCTGCGDDGTDSLTCRGPPTNKHCKNGSGGAGEQFTCR